MIVYSAQCKIHMLWMETHHLILQQEFHHLKWIELLLTNLKELCKIGLPSQLKVVIKFCIPTLFKNFMGMLENEFDNSSWNLESTFTVSSHIQGRKVSIKVIEAEKAIEVSGPGHKLWKDITFKRIATTLFGRFLQNFSVDLQSSIINTNTQLQMTSTLMVTRPNITSVPAAPPAETSRHQGIPMEGQMTIILELLAYHSKMITTLQEQLTSLTEEVVKLQENTPGRKASTEENQPPVRAKTKPGRKVSTEKKPISCKGKDNLPYCYLFLMSVFILWFSYYVNDIFCKF